MQTGDAMKTKPFHVLLAASLLLSGSAFSKEAAVQPPSTPPTPPLKPRVEVCFVLDTTGSMSGLIEGAKQKIWSIANDIISAKPRPEVRFGIVGYRDRGDAYITKRIDMTDDLDDIYAKLQGFRADGGGDTPESVSEALHEAVTKMNWTANNAVLKVIYLVGDAPPQAYQDGKDWRKVCKKALGNDLVINTIQCGNIAGTAEVWKAIASRGQGAYALIPQDGNMAHIDAPQDKQLAQLNAEMGKTLIPYGSRAEREVVLQKQSLSEAAAPAANASRVAVNSKAEKAVQGSGELLDELREGKRKLADVKNDELPEELQKLDEAELKAHLEKQQARRNELQTRIAVLVKERDTYLLAERKKIAASGKGDSFDEQVSTTLRAQAAKKNIKFE